MPTKKIPVRVYFENDTELDVICDQRDTAAWEASEVASLGSGATQVRYIAWSAATRSRLTQLSWKQWSAQVVEVNDPPAADGDDATPGMTAPSADI